MDDGLLMGMLHSVADQDEELQPLPHREPALVAISRDRHSRHILHGEVGPALRRRSGVEDLGDGGWSISASAWRSDSKRATTSRVSMPALISLTATRRRTGCFCSASHTWPMPPSR